MKDILKEFKEFAIRGSVIDLAVGIVVGGAFNKIISSFVTDVMMPPIGLLLGKVDFSNLYISLTGRRFSSLAEAQLAGIPTLNYGIFINNLISFIITAFAVFLLIKLINKLHRQEGISKESVPETKECPFCLSTIPIKARKCRECTSDL